LFHALRSGDTKEVQTEQLGGPESVLRGRCPPWGQRATTGSFSNQHFPSQVDHQCHSCHRRRIPWISAAIATNEYTSIIVTYSD